MKRSVIILVFLMHVSFGIAQKYDVTQLQAAILKADSLIEKDSREFFKNVESVIIYAQNHTLFEKYYNGFMKESLHPIQSQTKSIVSILLGIAIDKGFITDENEPVSRFFPEYSNADDKWKSALTIRDLLTMSAGFRWEEWIPFEDPGNDNRKMFQSMKWLDYAITRPMAEKPFTSFKYNSGCPIIIGAIIEKASGMKLDEFAEKYLFGPLEIKDCRWMKDSTGLCHSGGGLSLRPCDVMKIGVLMLNNGEWNNQRIVSEEWIGKSTTPLFATSLDNSTYGYFWWIRQMRITGDKSIIIISAEGAGGQNLYIFPDQKIIVAFTERNYSAPQVGPIFIRETILPLLK